MLKIVFHFIVLGVTVLVAANSSQAASFEYLYGQLRPTAEAAPISAVEPLAFVEESDDQVALTAFFDRVSGGKGGDGKDGDGKNGDGKGDCDECIGNWRDNMVVWFGADAYKSLGDTLPPPGFVAGYMNSAGVVAGMNTSVAIGDLRTRFQIGGSYGVYDFKGRDSGAILAPPSKDSSAEQQGFLTAGFYKRSDICDGERISWGVVYDQFWGHQWGLMANQVYLSQMRGIVGYAVNECHEVGVWGTLNTNIDKTAFAITPPPIRAANQINGYWRRSWDNGGSTMAYVGVADNSNVQDWLVGATAQAPLSSNLSLYSNVTFALPSSATGLVGSNELQWNVGAGLQYSFGGKAASSTVSGHKGMPLLPVANNGSFLITN